MSDNARVLEKIGRELSHQTGVLEFAVRGLDITDSWTAATSAEAAGALHRATALIFDLSKNGKQRP